MSLKAAAVKGASWTVGARLARTLLSLVALGVLSRFMGPAEFGVAALVTFVTAFAQMLADFGTRVALVQKKTITRIEEDSVYWSNMALGLVATGLVLAFSRPIARLLGDEAVAGPLIWVAPIFVIVAMQGLPTTMLERGFAFSKIAAVEVLSSLAGAVVAIVMAVMGWRLGALIAQQMVASLASTALTVAFSGWWPKAQFSMAALRPLLGYGRYVTASAMIQFFATSIDRPIIGNRLSAADLGYVSVVYQIVVVPMRIVVTMVRRVMFPIMSSIQDDLDRMRRGILDVQYGMVVVMAPVCFGLWALAWPSVRLLLGPGWDTAAALMGYSTLTSLFTVYTDVNAIIFSARGHAKFQFYWSVVSLAANVAVILLAVPYGIVALAAARLGLALVMVPINSWFAVRLLGMPLWDRILVTLGPLASAAGMAGIVWLADTQLAGAGAGHILRLAAGIPLGVLAYLALELLIDRRRFLPFARMLWAHGVKRGKGRG